VTRKEMAELAHSRLIARRELQAARRVEYLLQTGIVRLGAGDADWVASLELAECGLAPWFGETGGSAVFSLKEKRAPSPLVGPDEEPERFEGDYAVLNY
jgi:hypothetical protein